MDKHRTVPYMVDLKTLSQMTGLGERTLYSLAISENCGLQARKLKDGVTSKLYFVVSEVEEWLSSRTWPEKCANS